MAQKTEVDPFDWSKKTDEELLEAGLDLARLYYQQLGHRVPEGFKFYESKHPQEQLMWRLACLAFEELTGTCLTDVLENVQDSV